MVKVTSKEEIYRCLSKDAPAVLSTLLLYGSWNNLSDEELERKNSILHTIASTLLQSKTFHGEDPCSVCSLWLQADLNDEITDFCVGAKAANSHDDATTTPAAVDIEDIHLEAPDTLPALFMIHRSHQNVQTALVPINSLELNNGDNTTIFSAMNKTISNFVLDPQYKEFRRPNKRSLDVGDTTKRSKMNEQIRIFVAGDRSQVGKSSVCLGLLGTLLRMKYPPSSLAYIKPATQCEETQLVGEYCKKHGIEARPIGPVVYYKGFTRAYLSGDTESSEEMLKSVTQAVDDIARNKEVVVIDGVGYPSVGSITDTDNCSVALASGYPPSNQESKRIPPAVLIVGKRGVGDAIDSYNLNCTYFRARNVPVLGAIFNRLPIDGYYSLENCKKAIQSYFETQGNTGVCEEAFGFIPEIKGISSSRLKTENNGSDEKKSEVELAMDHAETLIKEFGKNVDVLNILVQAAKLRESLKDDALWEEDLTDINKRAKILDQRSAKKTPNSMQSSIENIRLSRDQIEEAAKSAGAAGG